ncbi:MAG: thioredoxin domain-containing protein [Ilumatobacteraceae bacterium]
MTTGLGYKAGAGDERRCAYLIGARAIPRRLVGRDFGSAGTHIAPEQVQRVRFRYWEYRNRAQTTPLATVGEACSDPGTLAPAEQPAGPGVASVIPAALIGATTINGDPFDAHLLAGRPTVAWFWAPWCAICRGEAPDVADIAGCYAGKVNFVGIAGRGEAPEMRDFVSRHRDRRHHPSRRQQRRHRASYEIYAQPAYAFITDDGRVETYVGSLGGDGLADIIDELIVA